MHLVALTELGTPVEQEAVALAAELGTAPYDERLNLNAGLPAVVLVTPEAERARALVERLRARGHRALACEAAALVSGAAMTSLRRFAIAEEEGGALLATDVPGARLPFADLLVLVRATHPRRTERTTEVKEQKFSLGRTLLSGGLVTSRTVRRDVVVATDEKEPVLYLFRRSGAPPWILREQGTAYTGLGASIEPSAHLNFQKLVALIHGRAPAAPLDERLVQGRRVPAPALRVMAPAPGQSAPPEAAIDLVANLIALAARDGSA